MELTAEATPFNEANGEEAALAAGTQLARRGMLIFLISEAMLFAGLISGYIVLRAGVPAWPPAGAPPIHIHLPPVAFMQWLMLINTALLISSSWTYHQAEKRIEKGRTGMGWFALTTLLGSVFLSIQAYEWLHLKHEGMWFNTHGVYGSSFFALTGFHGLHVFVGVILILVATIRSVLFYVKKNVLGSRAPVSHSYEVCAGLYWHFVDAVWILLFTLLYFI